MSHSMARLLLLACAFVLRVSADCDDQTIPITPITDVVLTNNKVWRGAQVQIGTPPVNFSMNVADGNNDTWVYNSTAYSCNYTTPAACLSLRGGFYDSSKSSSASGPVNVYAAGGDPRDSSAYAPNAFAVDTLAFGNSSLANFPFGMPGKDIAQADLGLGRNSTILNALKAAGRISSRSWSFWYGSAGAPSIARKDGHVVLGGYDAAQIDTSSNYTRQLSTSGCPLQIDITNIIMNFPNGTTFDLMQGSKPVVACISPDGTNILAITYDPYWTSFLGAAGMDTSFSGNGFKHGGTNGINFWDIIYPSATVFQGEVTFVLDSTFKVTFPNDLFVTPNPQLGDSGAITYNQTYSSILVDPLSSVNTNDLATLGKFFLQQAYLNVNYDLGIYSLFNLNANPTGSKLMRQTSNSTCTPSVMSSNSTTNSTTNSNSTTPVTPSSPTNTASPNNSISGGAIAGIIIGALAVVAIVAGVVIFFLLRNRKRKAASNAAPASGAETQQLANQYGENRPEAGAHGQYAASNDGVHELGDPTSTGIHEAYAPVRPKPAELPVQQVHHELPTGRWH